MDVLLNPSSSPCHAAICLENLKPTHYRPNHTPEHLPKAHFLYQHLPPQLQASYMCPCCIPLAPIVHAAMCHQPPPHPQPTPHGIPFPGQWSNLHWLNILRPGMSSRLTGIPSSMTALASLRLSLLPHPPVCLPSHCPLSPQTDPSPSHLPTSIRHS